MTKLNNNLASNQQITLDTNNNTIVKAGEVIGSYKAGREVNTMAELQYEYIVNGGMIELNSFKYTNVRLPLYAGVIRALIISCCKHAQRYKDIEYYFDDLLVRKASPFSCSHTLIHKQLVQLWKDKAFVENRLVELVLPSTNGKGEFNRRLEYKQSLFKIKPNYESNTD